MLETFANLRKYLHYNALLVWRTKAFWMRAVLCWMVGAVLLIYDESSSFDLRLKVRGPRPSATRIVLVDVNERDWSVLDHEARNVLKPLKEVVTLTDAYFWNAQAWEKLLGRIVGDQPSSVGVTLFFGENIRFNGLSQQARQIFEDPRVIWGADIDTAGRILIPHFASTYNANVGLRGVRADDDGSVRRFSNSPVLVPHLAMRLASLAKPELARWMNRTYESPELINYTGDSTSFTTVSAADIVEGRIPPGVFKDRVVIIGSLANSLEQLQTPLGRMSRSEVIANVTDNLLAKKNIRRATTSLYLAILALIMAGTIWMLTTYPQSVTLVTFGLFVILWSAGSAWAFDTLRFWLPIFSPVGQLILTCIVFLSYQLALNEKRTWRLEQEQRYLSEIEQLKTNFVSMMSHDLKTPIAKIQAICDRLIHALSTPDVVNDLKNLRRSSDELHRYIQSILQVTKVEAKDFKIQKEVTDINDDIERVVARLNPLAREKGIELITQLEPMFSIEVDTTLIQEVIHNLIENAIKYTPPRSSTGTGGVVKITSQEKDDNVFVVIEDTGPGIDPEDQKTIWRKFTRGRNQISGESEVKGTGLGLYLVKYFIELHGGQVFLESVLGRGTKVGFSIPIASESIETSPAPSASISVDHLEDRSDEGRTKSATLVTDAHGDNHSEASRSETGSETRSEPRPELNP